MAGKVSDELITGLLTYARRVGEETGKPYVSFIVKDNVIIASGKNERQITRDATNFDQVVAIRKAQEALDTNDLSGHTLVSLFEPPLMSFDIALWSGIRDFVWCINANTVMHDPQFYNSVGYTPTKYAEFNPEGITIQAGVREEEALALAREFLRA